MINIFQPNIPEESKLLLEEVFASKWLGRGEIASQFDEEMAKYLGINKSNFHSLSCCTEAIFACLHIFDLPKGSSIIIPSISFPAIPSAILEAGFKPKIVDIDINSGNICINSLREALDNQVSAVFVTDYGGIPNKFSKIREIIGEDRLLLVDGATSLGTFIGKDFSGSEADFCCWSYDAMKLLTCGEGGGVYCKDIRVMENLREYSYLGLPSDGKSGLDKSKKDQRWWEYQLIRPGRRSVFTNINAAIGLPQIKSLDSRIKTRNKIRKRYIDAFKNINQINVLEQNEDNVRYSNYFFSIYTDRRDKLACHLKDNGVYSTFRYYPVHRIEIFKKYSKKCINSDLFSENILNIPIHESLSNNDIEKIINLINGFYSL